jgi:sorting nexin-1/2
LEIVSSELKKGGSKSHIIYSIHGFDNIGKIDIIRRYSEFYLLREMLFSRYPGIFIPPIP